jgi:acyl-CoA reductase-like NAD-dependent aldehyde dehydrogenase
MAVTTIDYGLLIGGERVETGEWTEVRSPYSGELVGRVAKGGAEETKRALDAAAAALERPLPAHERARILDRVGALLEERHEEAARLISAEAGKPMKAARVEAQRAVSTFTFAAVEARRLAGEVVPMDASAAGEGKLAFTLRLPIGIIGAISPFNFPLNLVAHKVAPALAAGCPVVLKPASVTPLSAFFLAGLEEEAGLPDGWINVVSGSASAIGDVLVEDERVKLITFTGSGGVGWGIAERAHRKRVKLELGNATPAIVCGDAADGTAGKLAANAFSFAGQSCISVQRIFVMADAWDAFVPAFVTAVEALKVGDPADATTDVGPVIGEDDRDRILEWIRESRGEVLTGGDTTDDGLIRPTVIAEPDPGDKVQCEEVFGPVVTLTKTQSLDDAIERANATRYGLQAAIFTRDIAAATEAARRLEFGGVVINEAPTFRADQMPYGGVKASGNTREGPAWAVREMTEERLIVLSL